MANLWQVLLGETVELEIPSWIKAVFYSSWLQKDYTETQSTKDQLEGNLMQSNNAHETFPFSVRLIYG